MDSAVEFVCVPRVKRGTLSRCFRDQGVLRRHSRAMRELHKLWQNLDRESGGKAEASYRKARITETQPSKGIS